MLGEHRHAGPASTYRCNIRRVEYERHAVIEQALRNHFRCAVTQIPIEHRRSRMIFIEKFQCFDDRHGGAQNLQSGAFEDVDDFQRKQGGVLGD